MAETKTFESWAIVELMGHNRIAGKVSEETIGGTALLRVDVPETGSRQAYTRMFSSAAIYALNPVTEQVARMTAENIDAQPVSKWDLPEEMITALAKKMLREDPDLAQSALPERVDSYVDDEI